MTIRVAIAEDQRLVRELIAARIAREADMQVIAEAAGGRKALSVARTAQPDVLVLEIGLPELDGVEVVRWLREEHGDRLKIVALSTHTEPGVVRGMLQAGANGYLAKSAPAAELVHAVRTVMTGSLYLSTDVAHATLDAVPALGARIEPQLGRRERQVLTLLALGMRSSDIGGKLFISVATAEVHRRNIMRKLRLHSVAALTKYAIRQGFVPL